MSVIRIIVIALLLTVSCNTHSEINETDIMNTICIDGIKNLSIINGLDCYYHPVEVDGKFVRCND